MRNLEVAIITAQSKTRHFSPSNLTQRELGIVFYLGWPAFLGVLFGWTGTGAIGSQFDRPIAIAYWIAGFLLTRLALEVSIRLVAWAAPKDKTPLFALCLLSIPVHLIVGFPMFYLWKTMFLGYLPDGVEIGDGLDYIVSVPAFLDGLRSNVVVAIEWLLANYLFDRLLGFPRFRESTGYVEPQTVDVKDLSAEHHPKHFEPPRFLRKEPTIVVTDVVALSAEDHYVRIHTNRGSSLIHYRFSEAVTEMPRELGMQVHRSHWVKKNAINSLWKVGNGHRLSLGGDMEFPVSNRFIGLLKANGIEPTTAPTTTS